jgi:ABC-2 type transport system ATP-binding protein
VGLAQALIHHPEVLILDEPTIGLDPGQVVEVRKVIREMGKQRTVLLSTHILSEAQQICDRVLIINKGKIIAEDTPQNLQSRLVGSERASLRVRGDSDGLSKVVNKVKGVERVHGDSDGVVEFQFAPGQDVRPEVAKAVIEAGYDLLELRPIGMSLEEIFLELTREEPGAATKEK